MSRRSARLLNVGYYDQSSDDEISGSMVSYKESPVPRVFNKRKPRTGGHKGIQKPNQPIKVMAPTVRAVQRRQTFLSPTVAPSVAPVPLAPAASVALQPSMSSSSIGFTRIDSSGYCSDSEEPLRVKTRSNRRLSSGIGTRTSASASCSRSCFPTGLPSWFVIFLFLLPVLLTFPLEDKMDNIQREIEILKQKAHQHRGISQMVQRLNIDMRGVRSEMNNVRGKGNSVSIAVSTAGEQAMEKWLRDQLAQDERWDMKRVIKDCSRPLADRLPDFALESQGGSIVTSRCSETYHTRSACVSFLGIPLWYPEETPRTVIQGTMTIALSHPIHVTHVSLEHLSTAVSPNERIDSAPKDFAVYNPTAVYRYVELHVLSNWGHQDYTCVYRFRVHGKMASF
ncbi:unnamed protein product [Coregonus sp. 'balchen']|nr:unnamed protein product [Coregonus sp. 'balchen']